MGIKALNQGNASIAVLGLGNILLMDDGVGVHAVNALREKYKIPEHMALIDGGTMGLDLLPFIEGIERLLIIDAVNFKKEPGSIAIIEDGDIPSFLSSKLSSHQIGLSDVLSASKLIGITPPKMSLIGIQPDRMETGLGLSEKVERRFDELLTTVAERLREWGVELTPR